MSLIVLLIITRVFLTVICLISDLTSTVHQIIKSAHENDYMIIGWL